jgi:pyridoxal phosphate enzyme (YggS family)
VIDSVALRARLADVRERIARAADRAGRDPTGIRLVAVSKTFSAEHVRIAADTGQLDFGENKVQEALEKMPALIDLPLRWHFLGHVQSNKIKKAVAFDALHGVDNIEVLEKLEAAAAAAARDPEVLVQVDLAQEPTKFGAGPEDLKAIFAAAGRCRAAHVTGLMLLPPAVDDPNDARPYFRRLRTVRKDLLDAGIEGGLLGELSMGMSHDFEVAIEEGATTLRVGTAIFGDRHYA